MALNYNLRFPGQYYDGETGKHYNFNRDYDPVTGRYVQSDPIGLSGGDNGYLYGEANVIINIDTNGFYSFSKLKNAYQGTDAAVKNKGLPKWAIPFILADNGGSCAVRLSNAFNRAGYTSFLNSFSPRNRILKDNRGLKYVMGAAELARHLGVAKYSKRINNLSELDGRKGIAYFENFHIDLLFHEHISWFWGWYQRDDYNLVGNGNVTQNYVDRGKQLYFLDLPN